MSARLLAAVFAGGVLGTLGRVALVELVPAGSWPWPTLLANLAGAFALGALSVRPPRSAERRALLGPGLCGALTTFSTLQVEILVLLDDDRLAAAATYVAVSAAAGLAAVRLGTRVAA